MNIPMPSITPGRMPATKRSTMEVFETNPKRISGIDGGMRTETVDEAELIAAAKPPG